MITDDGRVPRRRSITGRGIQDGQPSSRGLELTGADRFPFLLCARAQGVLARYTERRAFFAEGLASSFGAFKETARDQTKPTDDADTELRADDPHGHVVWYVREVDAMLVEGRDPCAHPKIAATVERAIEEWKAGHKVLIFGHYRKTIDDLTAALEGRVSRESDGMASRALKMPTEDARAATERIAKSLRETDSLLRREIHPQLETWVKYCVVSDRARWFQSWGSATKWTRPRLKRWCGGFRFPSLGHAS